ncbi:MAG TPA: hypothetical protein VGC84_17645 [Ilumatobacteraceae bacterium]|jgi:hypothetical protein
MTGSPSGAAEAVELLRAEGYDDSIEVSSAGIWCRGCNRFHPVTGVRQERIYRFEGASNPDDMSIVVGLRCQTCGRTGIVVSAYGPGADPALFDILNQIPIVDGAHDPEP